MKIFNKTEHWNEKVNFVDSNNVVLGYDMSQHCCENADWQISNSPDYNDDDATVYSEDMNLEGYVFDREFFLDGDCGHDYGTQWVSFKIVHEFENDLYITLTNCHNGYYSHGFEFSQDDDVIESGAI